MSFEFKETKDLLQHRFPTTPQHEVTLVKFPCTGFCYMAIQEMDRIILMIQNELKTEYHAFISELIQKAGERKNNDPNIDPDGEFINAPTVFRDFELIANVTQYKEVAVIEDNLEIEINNLSLDLLEINVGGWILVNRSSETFVAFKMDIDRFWIIDSHQPFHGEVDLERMCAYVMRNGQLRSSLQLGLSLV